MDIQKLKRWTPVVTVFLLLVALWLVKQFTPESSKTQDKTEVVAKGLNRNPSKINYSKHARCRMDCRKIDETEVAEILQKGKINYAKSEIGDQPDCRKKYAVEGTTHDNQRVRIIFAPCKDEMTVVTVIDIGKEWPCDCR